MHTCTIVNGDFIHSYGCVEACACEKVGCEPRTQTSHPDFISQTFIHNCDIESGRKVSQSGLLESIVEGVAWRRLQEWLGDEPRSGLETSPGVSWG